MGHRGGAWNDQLISPTINVAGRRGVTISSNYLYYDGDGNSNNGLGSLAYRLDDGAWTPLLSQSTTDFNDYDPCSWDVALPTGTGALELQFSFEYDGNDDFYAVDNVVVANKAATLTWNANGGGTWDENSSNWTYNSASTTFLPGDNVAFGAQSATAATVSVQASGVNCGAFTVNSNTTDYTFDGGDVTIGCKEEDWTNKLTCLETYGSSTITLNGKYTTPAQSGSTANWIMGEQLNLVGELDTSESNTYVGAANGANVTVTGTLRTDTRLSIGHEMYYGDNSGSAKCPGSMTINGGILDASNSITIGNRTNGDLTVTNGGIVEISGISVQLVVGGWNDEYDDNDRGSLTVDNSTLTITSTSGYSADLAIAGDRYGRGVCTIQNNAYVQARYCDLSNNDFCRSHLTVQSGGTLSVKQVKLGNQFSFDTQIDIDGGTIQARATNATWISPDTTWGEIYYNINFLSGGATLDSNGYDVGASAIFEGEGGLTKTGAGTLTLSGANEYQGVTTVAEGTLVLESDAQDAVFTLGGADIQTESGSLVFDYAEGDSPADTVRTLLADGDISCSIADSSHGLGFADDSGEQEVTVQYALLGDANLDNTVDLLDLTTLSANWSQSDMIWSEGDFNYDGEVDLLDLTILGSNWGSTDISFQMAMASMPMTVQSVPEPSTIALLLSAMLALAAVVRRKK